MPLRLKTIEYPFPTHESQVASGIRHEFGALTVHIPESGSRTFRSVTLEVSYRSSEVAAAAVTARLLGIKLGGAGFSDVTLTETLTNTATHTSMIMQRDVTSYFTTNYAGMSTTCQVAVNITGIPIINITAKLIITYEYDDTGVDTRIKTVKIPLDTSLGDLPNVLTELGVSQVPLLDTFLPEASKVYRQVWFEIEGVEVSSNTTDFNLGLELDAEGEDLDGLHRANLTPQSLYRYLWVRNDMTKNATHAFKARTTVASKMLHPAIVLCVTYEYSHTLSANIIQSLWMPLFGEAGYVGGTTSPFASRFEHKFFVEEPGPVTFRQSGIVMSYLGPISSLLLKVGVQSTRTYTNTGTPDGSVALSHRIDAGALAGSALTLNRGEVTLSVESYRTADGPTLYGSALTCMAYFNYVSARDGSGDGVHAHSVHFLMRGDALAADNAAFTTGIPVIPETSYDVKAIGHELLCETPVTRGLRLLSANGTGGEQNNQGWIPLATQAVRASGKRSMLKSFASSRRLYKRFSNDADSNRLGVETARQQRLSFLDTARQQASVWVTYASKAFSISGALAGFAGDGSGIVVDLFRSDTRECVVQAVSSVGGGYSVAWFDDTIPLYAVARETATRVGRSDNTLAT